MLIDISDAELHNLVKRKNGLEVREALVDIKQPTVGCKYVGGFSAESPFTTEVWHYLFEQNTTDRKVTLRVYTEDFVEMYSHGLGALPSNPIITHAIYNNQIMINGPSFSTPLYGLVGGGIIDAVKTESQNPDSTALEIMPGLICSFGDRMPIAQGNIVYFNDPGVDPRTYVSQNALPLPGTVYDMFQGDDGALYMFTSAGVFFMAQDALGKGQRVEGFVGSIPGLQISKSRNAAASNGVVAVLQRHGVAILGGRNQVIDVAPYKGPRYAVRQVEVEDYRISGEIHATPEGFIVAFRGQEGFFLDFNLREGYRSYVWHPNYAFYSLNVVGTLRSRENSNLLLLEDRVVMSCGNFEFYIGAFVRGCAAIEVDSPEGIESLVRRGVLSSDNASGSIGMRVGHSYQADTTPTRGSDVVIGTTEWDNAGKYNGRRLRSTRFSFSERMTNMPLEVFTTGSMRRLESNVELIAKGQGRKRGDKR